MIIKRTCKTDKYKSACLIIKIHIHDIVTIFSLLLNKWQACKNFFFKVKRGHSDLRLFELYLVCNNSVQYVLDDLISYALLAGLTYRIQ